MTVMHRIEWNFLAKARPDLPLGDRLKLATLGFALPLLSFGVPFIHMGQEIAQSKFGHENTYNEGDRFNKMSYRLLDERKALYNTFRSLVALRRECLAFRPYDPRVIEPMVEIEDFGEGIAFAVSDEVALGANCAIKVFLNPSSRPLEATFKEKMSLLFDGVKYSGEGLGTFEKAEVPPYTAMVFALRKEN